MTNHLDDPATDFKQIFRLLKTIFQLKKIKEKYMSVCDRYGGNEYTTKENFSSVQLQPLNLSNSTDRSA